MSLKERIMWVLIIINTIGILIHTYIIFSILDILNIIYEVLF